MYNKDINIQKGQLFKEKNKQTNINKYRATQIKVGITKKKAQSITMYN